MRGRASFFQGEGGDDNYGVNKLIKTEEKKETPSFVPVISR